MGIFDIMRPHYWYAAAINCNGPLDMSYKVFFFFLFSFFFFLFFLLGSTAMALWICLTRFFSFFFFLFSFFSPGINCNGPLDMSYKVFSFFFFLFLFSPAWSAMALCRCLTRWFSFFRYIYICYLIHFCQTNCLV